MSSFLKTAWALHPWLTGLEVLGALLLAVLPFGLLLALVGGVGWLHALRAGAPVAAFTQATYGGLGLFVFAALSLFASAGLFRGGILPH